MFSPDIFISYSREDRDYARKFAQSLANEGFRVWWDDAIHSGQTFDTVIEQELRAAKAVVVLWSPRSVGSRWVRSEASIADRNGRLVPVIIEPCERPIMFELTHTVDLSKWDGTLEDPAWMVFMKDLAHLMDMTGGQAQGAPSTVEEAATPAPAAQVPPVPQPTSDAEEYEATQFFTAEQRDDFLGPDRHCLELYNGDHLEMRIVVAPLGLMIGRAPPADVVLADPLVSRKHCQVEIRNGGLHVTDLNSTNGTFVGGQKIDGEAPLEIGSSLSIGTRSFVYHVRDKSNV